MAAEQPLDPLGDQHQQRRRQGQGHPVVLAQKAAADRVHQDQRLAQADQEITAVLFVFLCHVASRMLSRFRFQYMTMENTIMPAQARVSRTLKSQGTIRSTIMA